MKHLMREFIVKTHDNDGFPYPLGGVALLRADFLAGAIMHLKEDAAQLNITNYTIREEHLSDLHTKVYLEYEDGA